MDNEKKTIAFEFSGVMFELTNPSPGVWRIISFSDGVCDRKGAAQFLAGDLGEEFDDSFSKPARSDENGDLKFASPDGSYVVLSRKSVSFFDCGGKLRRKLVEVRKSADGLTAVFELPKGVRVYGTGERFDSVDRRGKESEVYSIDKWCRTKGNSYCPVPYVICSDLVSVFLNRFEYSNIKAGKKLLLEQKYAPLDIYITMADSPSQLLESYSRLTGFAPVPAEWNFGILVCRYHPEFETKEGVLAMADAMEKNSLPWDAVIMEGFHTYEEKNFELLKDISGEVHKRGKKLMVYEQCGRIKNDSAELHGVTDEYAVQSKDGVMLHETRSLNFVDNFQNKTMKCIDITSEKSRERWFEYWKRFVFEADVDGAKIDFCEQFPDQSELNFGDGRRTRGAHHWYPVEYNTLMYRFFNSKPDGGMNFSRGGGIGAQRYPFIWAGDQRREFYFLAPVIKAALSLGLSGVPFVSWDLGGYMPSFNPYDKKHEKDVFLRGAQFTAFSPVMQTHGKVTRPYDFDGHTVDVYRIYCNIHQCLRPYLKEQAEVCCKTGLPMMRHLFLYDHEDLNCLDTEDEYMLGNSLLVAPVLRRKNKRTIYLPKGEWTDIVTGEKFTGPVRFTRKIGPDCIPVFRLSGTESPALDESLEKAGEYLSLIAGA